MNINSYKEFLSSISHVSRLNLQVWNCKGEVLFSSEADPSKDPSFEEIRDFSFQIMRQGTFQYKDLEGKEHTFKADPKQTRVLLHEIDHLNGITCVEEYEKGTERFTKGIEDIKSAGKLEKIE